MRIRFLESIYLGSFPIGSRLKRAGKGTFVFEELHDGSIVHDKPFYLLTRTYKVGFLSFTSFTKVEAMTSDEATDWILDNLGDDAYAELLVQQENAKGYYETAWGQGSYPPLFGKGASAPKKS